MLAAACWLAQAMRLRRSGMQRSPRACRSAPWHAEHLSACRQIAVTHRGRPCCLLPTPTSRLLRDALTASICMAWWVGGWVGGEGDFECLRPHMEGWESATCHGAAVCESDMASPNCQPTPPPPRDAPLSLAQRSQTCRMKLSAIWLENSAKGEVGSICMVAIALFRP